MLNEYILKIPQYRKYSILKSESLNNLSNNFINYLQIKYTDYSEGIITGFNISYIEEEFLFKIDKGLIKMNEEVYFVNTCYVVRPNKEGRYTLILEKEKIIDEDYKSYKFFFRFITTDEISKDHFEIFSIILRDGASIYTKLTKFSEFSEEFNFINQTNQKYSIKNSNKSSLHPKIISMWANEMLKLKLNDIDISLCLLALNNPISKETLISYINLNLQKNIKKISNTEILTNLIQILNMKNKNEEKGKIEDDEITTNFFVS